MDKMWWLPLILDKRYPNALASATASLNRKFFELANAFTSSFCLFIPFLYFS